MYTKLFSLLVDFTNNTYSLIHTIKVKSILHNAFTFDRLGSYRERETPGPIPNPEAKPLIADNTASFRCGNVGRRLVDQFTSIHSKLHFLINDFYNLNRNLINVFILLHAIKIHNLLIQLPSCLDIFTTVCSKLIEKIFSSYLFCTETFEMVGRNLAVYKVVSPFF